MHMYGNWRSAAAFRVRIALNLKGVPAPETVVDLDAGDQHAPAFRAVNPMGAVPALVLDDGTVLTQSLAILEWIEEAYPAPPLLPDGAAARARVRALCAITAADTHPLVVPRVQKYLTEQGWDLERRTAWNAHWFGQGLQGYEAQVGPGPFVAGIAPGMADICLASHVAGAERFGLSLDGYPNVRRIHEACIAMPEFSGAHPLRQPGAPA